MGEHTSTQWVAGKPGVAGHATNDVYSMIVVVKPRPQ